MKQLLAALVATWFFWIADNGVPSFTDDPARVPAHYQAQAIEPRPLACYQRATLVGPGLLALARTCEEIDERPLELAR